MWLRGWLARLGDPPAGRLAISYIAQDDAGQCSLVEQLADVPPNGSVIVPAYAVVTTFKRPGGGLVIWALSELVFTLEAAERKRRQLLGGFPKCAVISTPLTYDPTNAEQRTELDMCHRRMVAEMMRAR
jgi:hypothetical protein